MEAADNKFKSTQTTVLGETEFDRLGKYIMSQYGIKMPSQKKIFLQNRLQKRLRELNIKDFKEYADFVFSPRGQKEELSKMIDAVSTNKTDFFREPLHFDFLFPQGLDEYISRKGKKTISVWSAGCSSGEEPYTIAMLLKEYSQTKHFFDFGILATDISDSVLQLAGIGIYNLDKIESIPANFHTKYLQKGSGKYENKFRIVSEIRKKVAFQKLNLLKEDYNRIGKFDILFCRNVLIYFERHIQNKILMQLCQHISAGGYLFLGHSESIAGFDLPLMQLRPTIFMKTDHLT